MKILLVHNFYGSSAPSGENIVYLAEKELLERKGHEVIEYTTSSDNIRAMGLVGLVLGAVGTPWNFHHLAKIRKLIHAEQPDIMHVHNTFPILSPAIFHAVRAVKTATILTLHNYRLFCSAGIPLRDSKPCTECLDKNSVWPAIRYSCYRNCRVATLPMALMIALHKSLGTWKKHVDAYIALTAFQREKLVSAGLDQNKVHIKPHFYPSPPTPIAWSERSDTIVYIGRLGEEKGVKYLVEAWQQWGDESPKLEIIGEGPLSRELRVAVGRANLGNKIEFLGKLSFEKVQEKLARSKLLVLPSIWFEGFPMVIREAFSLGVPAAASNLGSMPCIINNNKDGVLFNPGDSGDLLRTLQSLWQDQGKLAELASNARIEFEQKYTEDTNYESLMKIYQAAIQCKNESES